MCIRDSSGSVLQTRRVSEDDRIVCHIRIKIDAPVKPDGILGQEAPGGWVVVSRAVVVESGFLVRLASSVLEGISKRAGGSHHLAVRIVCVGVRQRPCRIA